MNFRVKNTKASRPLCAWILIVLQFFIGAAALICGAMFFLAPDGHLMQMPVTFLKGSPFNDFLIPGIILFVFVGIFPVLVGVGLVKKSTLAGYERLESLQELLLGLDSVLGSRPYHPDLDYKRNIDVGVYQLSSAVYYGLGLALILLTLLPGVRRWYRKYGITIWGLVRGFNFFRFQGSKMSSIETDGHQDQIVHV